MEVYVINENKIWLKIDYKKWKLSLVNIIIDLPNKRNNVIESLTQHSLWRKNKTYMPVLDRCVKLSFNHEAHKEPTIENNINIFCTI